jgi:hypothetical protein
MSSSSIKGAIVNRYLRYQHPTMQAPMRLPLVQVRLSTNVTAFETLGLLDSGSTSTFLPTELAEILGLQIDPATSKPAVGAGGEFRTVDFHVTIVSGSERAGGPVRGAPEWKHESPRLQSRRESICLVYSET